MKSGVSDWKQRYRMVNAGFERELDIDEFLERVKNCEFNPYRRIVFPEYDEMQTIDPEGLAMLTDTLKQFSREYPERAFIFKELEVKHIPTRVRIWRDGGNLTNPNWNERIVIAIHNFVVDIDYYLTNVVLEGRLGNSRQLQILGYDDLRMNDPEAFNGIISAVEQFNRLHPDLAVDIIQQ